MVSVTKNHLPPSIHHLPLIVIVGPTASGKTSLAIKLAEKFNGEIICADSRTVYEGLDIGTAKPTVSEQQRVRHWGLDLAGPGDNFTASDFKKYALDKIDDIRSRGKVPFLVGGTGLYVDGVVFDYQFKATTNSINRGEFERMSLEELHAHCTEHNIIMPENTSNKRYVIRAIENNGVNTSRRDAPIDNCIIVGITTETKILKQRIKLRSEQIFDDGVVKEAKKMGEIYGWKSQAMTGNIYRIIYDHLNGDISLSDLRLRSGTLDWRLAKRQLTWFKRNEYIEWHNLDGAESRIGSLLAKQAVS